MAALHPCIQEVVFSWDIRTLWRPVNARAVPHLFIWSSTSQSHLSSVWNPSQGKLTESDQETVSSADATRRDAQGTCGGDSTIHTHTEVLRDAVVNLPMLFTRSTIRADTGHRTTEPGHRGTASSPSVPYGSEWSFACVASEVRNGRARERENCEEAKEPRKASAGQCVMGRETTHALVKWVTSTERGGSATTTSFKYDYGCDYMPSSIGQLRA
ncbi:hypothetical protein BKA81DRAFT_425674 [Phyllosticta paracitricarpa]|uniref:Uncharacterized protein n=1 Tax=Phyllosticta citricarpa TaxID=55181 RepID=A0ABR1MLC6_9PEZI